MYVCDHSLGTYKLLCKKKDAPDWITLSSFEKIAAPIPETPAPHDSENTMLINSGSSAVNTPIPSGSSSPGIDCASIEGAVVIANDGTTLGYILFSAYDAKSIFNNYGSFGSKYSATSIWNTYGQYGGKYSDMSPWNDYATKPPSVKKNGRTLCALTVGNLSTKVCNTFEVESCFRSK